MNSLTAIAQRKGIRLDVLVSDLLRKELHIAERLEFGFSAVCLRNWNRGGIALEANPQAVEEAIR